MVHLVYCDDKEKVLEKIISGKKTMVIRGAAGRKIPTAGSLMEKLFISWKKVAKKYLRPPPLQVCKISLNFQRMKSSGL